MSSVVDKIPEGWVETTLGEISKVKGGKRMPKGEALIEQRTKHPYIRITDFEGNYINKNQLMYVPNDTFEKISRYIVNENDVIISIVGTIGLVAKIDYELNNANLTENCVKLINLKNTDNNFLYYYLTSRIGQYEINKNTVGAVQKKLPIYGVQSIKINLPPLQEQKAIAQVLTAFDDKIENLRAQNQTLETLAQTIFKEWFGKYQVGDELPEGWRFGKITELFEVRDGTHDSPKEKPIGFKLITSKHLDNNRLLLEDAYFISKDDYNKINKRSKVEKHDILFSMIGTIGLAYFELNNNIDYAIKNVALFKCSQNKKWANYTYLWLTSFLGRHFVATNKSGSTQEYVSLTSLRNIDFIIPLEQKLSEFNFIMNPIFKKISSNSKQIQSLTKTRDTLLPKLMSGQLRVNEFINN